MEEKGIQILKKKRLVYMVKCWRSNAKDKKKNKFQCLAIRESWVAF